MYHIYHNYIPVTPLFQKILSCFSSQFKFFFDLTGDQSGIGRRSVGNRSPTGRRLVASSREDIPMRLSTNPNQSATSPRSVADKLQILVATSAVVMNYDRLQCTCMCDWGFKTCSKTWLRLIWSQWGPRLVADCSGTLSQPLRSV